MVNWAFGIGANAPDLLFFDVSKLEILRGSNGDAFLARTIEVGGERLQQMVHSWAA